MICKFVEVASIEELDYTEDVYDITVDDNHNFFANGLLVHNCVAGAPSYEIFKHFQQLESANLNADLLDNHGIRSQIMASIGNTYDRMVDAVGADSVMFELQFNKLPAQHLTNRALIEFAKDNGIEDKLIVTCDSHYSQPDHWKEREIYKQLGFLGKKEPDPSLLPNSKEDLKCELYPKNHDQVWETYNATRGNFSFYDDQLICDAIERTHDIAHQVIGDIKPDTSMKLPSYVVPKNMSADKALIELCKDGLINRGLAEKPEYIDRLHYELKVIKEKQFSKYFLTKKKIIDLAWKKMFVGPGRGSGAGSLVNYVLGITDIDPIKYDLLFERFLDPSRTEYPDIDTDVSDRDALIKSLRTEFGVENVVPISNYNTFKLKSLIKDVARFYGISFQEVNSAIASLESDVKAGRKSEDVDEDAPLDISIEEALKFSPKTKKFLEEHEEIFEPLQVLFKQNRALGRHAGGVIVSENIAERMPLIMTKGERQTPWVEGMTAKHLESFGWVKFDLLGLETLRMFEMTIERILKKEGNKSPSFEDIKSWYNEHLNPTTMNLDDQRVYEEVYHAGAFAAVFQCTQKGAQALFKKAKPVSIMDIATLTAIYRPGPLSAKVDQTYIKAKQNPDSVDYGHPLIKQVLEPEYGHIVFQESAMSLCHIVAGIPKIELNTVRKMMKPGGSSGENIEKAKALRERFVSGCVGNGVDKAVAEKLYEKILWFSAYGFNKCHSLSYSMISYICAWFLTYHREEWLASYLEVSSPSPKKLMKAISEVRALGYQISKVDVNYSGESWTCVDGKSFVPSFYSCKGIGASAISEIIENRPYASIETMLWNEDGSWRHSGFNKKAVSVLLQLGAFESIDWRSTFSSYKQFHNIVIDNWDDLKKSTKKDPHKGQNIFKQLLLESEDKSEWTFGELAGFSQDLSGTINIAALLPEKLLNAVAAKGILDLDKWSQEDVYWFMVIAASNKKTKTGRNYVIMNVVGLEGKVYKLWVWNAEPDSIIKPFTLAAAQIKSGDMGYSTNWNKIIQLSK